MHQVFHISSVHISRIIFQESRCVKYAKILVFTDPYSTVSGQNLQLFPYTGEYRSVKTCVFTHILSYD